MAESLVVDEDFAAYLQRDLDRATAELALAGASGVVRAFCRWSISAEETTFTVDGTGSTILRLPTMKLNGVDAVAIDGTALDPGEYRWSAGGLIERAAGWPRRFRVADVTCSHGYALDDMPDAIRIVVLALAARYYGNPDGLRSKTVGDISRTFLLESMRGDMTELETALIGGYRLP